MKEHGQRNQIVGKILNLCKYYFKLILTTPCRRKALKLTKQRVVCGQSPQKQEGAIIKVKATTAYWKTTKILAFYFRWCTRKASRWNIVDSSVYNTHVPKLGKEVHVHHLIDWAGAECFSKWGNKWSRHWLKVQTNHNFGWCCKISAWLNFSWRDRCWVISWKQHDKRLFKSPKRTQ